MWRGYVRGMDRHTPIARRLRRDDRGATAIEYGLIAALIAVAAISAMQSVGGKLGNTFNNVSSKLK